MSDMSRIATHEIWIDVVADDEMLAALVADWDKHNIAVAEGVVQPGNMEVRLIGAESSLKDWLVQENYDLVSEEIYELGEPLHIDHLPVEYFTVKQVLSDRARKHGVTCACGKTYTGAGSRAFYSHSAHVRAEIEKVGAL